MINVTALRKSYHDKKHGTVDAVAGLDFACERGEIFGLLGLNGAGKTTCLRLMATMLRPDSGRITINGHDTVDEPEAVRSAIGFLSGTTGLYLRLSPREILMYFGQLAGLDRTTIRRRSDELIERLDMGDFADRRVDKLSTGQKQKASIARTLIHDPPVLILDEPTAALDVVTSRAIVEFIAEARAAGKCIIFSTHQMHEAAKLCDRIGIIHKGKMQVIGTLESFRARWGDHDLDDIFVSAINDADGDE